MKKPNGAKPVRIAGPLVLAAALASVSCAAHAESAVAFAGGASPPASAGLDFKVIVPPGLHVRVSGATPGPVARYRLNSARGQLTVTGYPRSNDAAPLKSLDLHGTGAPATHTIASP